MGTKKYKIKINQWCQKLKNLLLLYVHTQQKILEKKKEATAAASSASKLTSHVSMEKEIEKREKISSQKR